MNSTEVLLNIDLAASTTALVALGMVVVPNIDRIRLFRRAIMRGTFQRMEYRRQLRRAAIPDRRAGELGLPGIQR